MRLTVIPYDKLVIKDGEGYNVDNLDYLDSNINAIQWYDDKGEIEYDDGTENLSQILVLTINALQIGIQQKLNMKSK